MVGYWVWDLMEVWMGSRMSRTGLEGKVIAWSFGWKTYQSFMWEGEGRQGGRNGREFVRFDRLYLPRLEEEEDISCMRGGFLIRYDLI